LFFWNRWKPTDTITCIEEVTFNLVPIEFSTMLVMNLAKVQFVFAPELWVSFGL